MEALLHAALKGVDPTAPGATWQIFLNLMAVLPWRTMLALTLMSVVVAIGIARHRGSSVTMAVLWALLIGPAGWLLSWYAVPAARTCPRCQASVTARRSRCPSCGCRMSRDP